MKTNLPRPITMRCSPVLLGAGENKFLAVTWRCGLRVLYVSMLWAALSVFARAALVAVQFEQTGVSTTQAGFSPFSGNGSQTGVTSLPFSTVAGTVNVSLNTQIDVNNLGGGYFMRPPGITNSGALTFADLYNSFVFNNSSNGFTPNQTTSITLTLSGAGISASRAYQLTFYSWDNNPAGESFSPKGHQVTFAGVSGTSGTASLVSQFDTAPTANNTYAVSQNYTSDSSGNLTFLISDFSGTLSGGAARSGVRLNAFQLNTVPEPGTVTLCLLSLGVCMARRRRARV